MVAPFLDTKIVALAVSGPEILAATGPAAGGLAPRLVATVDFSLAGGALEVAEFSLDQLDANQKEWVDLAQRAIEPNPFYEPGFALAAALHFPARERPRFIVVRDGAGRMKGLFPIVPSNPVTGDGLIRLWLHKQAALATPLVDRDQAPQVIEAFLDWIEGRSLASGVTFSRMTTNGRFHAALNQSALLNGRRVETLDSYERAALLPGATADETCARAGSRKKLNELHRLRRRLAEMGQVEFETCESADDVRRATEEFLALEASGWKAGRGAFLSEPSLTTFLRSAMRLLAREGRCKIDSLRLDGRPIAMAITLESQGRSYIWKIAFDENFRTQAPGIQLIYERTRRQLARPEIEMTDSCAIANHPMIDRLWPDRVGVCDLAVQLRTTRERDFMTSCRRNQTRRQIRDFAKRAANRLLKRKVS